MAIVDANQIASAGISSNAATTPEQAPASAPDLSGYSKEQLADMLKAGNNDGSAV